MGKLVAIVGNSGSGKTTLARLLCKHGSFKPYLEQHEERPFQESFQMALQRYSLANQIDYMLFRAEQEHIIKQDDALGIQDGGLDQDFYVFTRFFFQKGYLDQREYSLCQRLYLLLRQIVGPPDLMIRLLVPLDTLAERKARRDRQLDIVTLEELGNLELFLNDWLEQAHPSRIVEIDVRDDDPTFSKYIGHLTSILQKLSQE